MKTVRCPLWFTVGLMILIRAEAAGAALLPVEDFARLPIVRHPTISRDGRTLLYGVIGEKDEALGFRDLVTGKIRAVDGNLGRPEWVNADRVVYGYLEGIDRDGKDYRGLLGMARQNDLRDQEKLIGGAIIFKRFTEDKKDKVLMTEYDQPAGVSRYGYLRLFFPNVIEMNTRTGRFVRVLKNPGNVIAWLADGSGVVRCGVEWEKGMSRVIYRENEAGAWRPLAGLEFAQQKVAPLWLAADGKLLYVALTTPTGRWGVYAYDLEASRIKDLILSHDLYDVMPLNRTVLIDGFLLESAVLAGDSREILGIRYVTDRPTVFWFDQEMAAVQAALDQGLPKTINTIVDFSDGHKKMVVLSWSARDPGTYYLFDLEKKELKPLFPRMPWIKPGQMAEAQPVDYPSRDGLTIHGYLTVPAGREAKGLPLIVLPHDGPWQRDSWAFDPDIQFLASRGYAVLQMNYRGSSGYGQDFFEQGRKKVGREMQNDIEDGTRWAIAQGFADPSRIAIMGAGFGGYSALMGLMRTPELYRCGIDLAGVTDWAALLKFSQEVSQIDYGTEGALIGDPSKDAGELAEISPVNHVAALRAPLLMVYGRGDAEQAKLLTKALDREKKPYDYFEEGTSSSGFKNRIERYKRIERFLAQHLPVDGPAAASAVAK